MLQVGRACALVACLATTAHADDGDRWDGVTLATQAGAGVATGAVAGGVTGLIGAGIVRGAGSKDGLATAAGAIVGFAVGGVVGIVAGVKLGGDHRDGTGTLLGTMLGEAAGLVVLGTFETIVRRARWHPGLFRIVAMTTCLLGGPLVGYHLSADPSTQPAPRLVIPIVVGGF